MGFPLVRNCGCSAGGRGRNPDYGLENGDFGLGEGRDFRAVSRCSY